MTNTSDYVSKILADFFENNPHCSHEIDENNNLVIENPWQRDDAKLIGSVDDKDFIKALNSIRFSKKFDAIYHMESNTIEFIYSFLNPDDADDKHTIDRKFKLNFEGKSYQCIYQEPTESLLKIAQCFHRVHFDLAERSVRQIIPFRDFQKIDTLNDRAKSFFKNRVPRSFFIKCTEETDEIAIESIARHLNLIMTSYDRMSPIVQVYEEFDSEDNPEQIRYINGTFPTEFSVSEVDGFLLKLLEVGRRSSARFAFVYYYQIFEYAGYYHLDSETRAKLKRFLKDPTVVSCSEDKISELQNLLPSLNHNDDVKIRKVIEAHCDPRVIWKEIENDKTYFSNEQIFDGDFSCKPLVAHTTDLESWNTMWMPKLYDYLTKMRNSLVHARERRENKVILPTKSNNKKLERVTPLIRRMAEQIVFGSSR